MRDLETFVYAVSHDMSAPIRAVNGFSRLIMDREGGRFDDKTRQQFEHIMRAGEELQSMLWALTEYSRLSTRPGPIQPAPAADVLALAQSTLERDIDTTRAIVECDLEPALMLHGDIARLARMFSCLLSNALVFRAAGRTPRIHIVGWMDGDTHRFRITDNGIGMILHPDTKERIFRPFGRLHRPEEYPGIGMGLTLARKIAGLHGGDLDVEAAPGEGCRFLVSLRMKAAPSIEKTS